MGATAHIKSMPSELIAILLRQPELVEAFVCCYPPQLPPGMPEALRKQLAEDPTLAGMRLESQTWLRDLAPGDADALIRESSQPVLYLDKAWKALSDAISPGEGEGLGGRCILGVREIGPDLGYGRARYLTPEEVVETSSALEAVVDANLKHPMLLTLFSDLKAYYAAAASKQHGMLLHLA